MLGPLVRNFVSALPNGAKFNKGRVRAVIYGSLLHQALKVDLMPEPWHYEALAIALQKLLPIQTTRDLPPLCSNLQPNDNPWQAKIKNFMESWRNGDYPKIPWPRLQQWMNHLAAARPGSTCAQRFAASIEYFEPDEVVSVFLARSTSSDQRLYATLLKDTMGSETGWMLREASSVAPAATVKSALAAKAIAAAPRNERNEHEVLTQTMLLQQQQDHARDNTKAEKLETKKQLEEARHYAISTDGGRFFPCNQSLHDEAKTLDIPVGNALLIHHCVCDLCLCR